MNTNNMRDQFERAYAEAHDIDPETFYQYRMGDTYRLPQIAKCWRFWQMAVESGLDPSHATKVMSLEEQNKILTARCEQLEKDKQQLAASCAGIGKEFGRLTISKRQYARALSWLVHNIREDLADKPAWLVKTLKHIVELDEKAPGSKK